MRAAVYHGRRDVRIETVPDPARPRPGEVILRVRACAICGTDVSEFLHGPLMVPLAARHPASGHVGPTILGHEFVGQVVAAGENTELREGTRVVPGAGYWCGACRWCLDGRPNLCASYYVFGLHAHGGLAGFARVPAKMCHAVPDGCPDEWAAMAQPYAIALHAARRSGARPGDTVVLIGVGGIGSFLLAALRAVGVESIFALDVSQERLSTAARLGAARTLLAGEDTQASAATIRGWTAGQGADVVIEASGAPLATLLALSCARRGGSVLQVGLPTEPTPLPLRQFTVPEINLVTTNGHVCATDLPRALALLATTDFARAVLGRVIPLEALVDEGLLALAERRAKGKVVVALE
jgi:(R,R)-butanediol dehydrogenase / meso-butanediol dehydrogenase / diacetyl reductase